jgi:hypothetical protein
MRQLDLKRLALILAVAVAVIRCGSSTTAPSSVADLSVTSTVVNAHSHTINVTASDQLHAADTTYTTSNAMGHTHTLTLTAGQLSSIAAGGTVTVTSSMSTTTGSHTHDFTFQGKK